MKLSRLFHRGEKEIRTEVFLFSERIKVIGVENLSKPFAHGIFKHKITCKVGDEVIVEIKTDDEGLYDAIKLAEYEAGKWVEAQLRYDNPIAVKLRSLGFHH